MATRRAPESRRFPQLPPPRRLPPVADVRPFTVKSPHGNHVDNTTGSGTNSKLRTPTYSRTWPPRTPTRTCRCWRGSSRWTTGSGADGRPREAGRLQRSVSAARLVVLPPLRYRPGLPDIRTQEGFTGGARAGHARRAAAGQGAPFSPRSDSWRSVRTTSFWLTPRTPWAAGHTRKMKNLATGQTLPDRIENVEASLAWAADNRTVLYVEKDPGDLPRPARPYASTSSARIRGPIHWSTSRTTPAHASRVREQG